jgi:hypothetical protein
MLAPVASIFLGMLPLMKVFSLLPNYIQMQVLDYGLKFYCYHPH